MFIAQQIAYKSGVIFVIIIFSRAAQFEYNNKHVQRNTHADTLMCNRHKCVSAKISLNFSKMLYFLRYGRLLSKAIYFILLLPSAEMAIKTIRIFIYANAKLLQMANYTIHFVLGHKEICLQAAENRAK